MHKEKINKIINDPIYGFINIESGIITKTYKSSLFPEIKKDKSIRTILSYIPRSSSYSFPACNWMFISYAKIYYTFKKQRTYDY